MIENRGRGIDEGGNAIIDKELIRHEGLLKGHDPVPFIDRIATPLKAVAEEGRPLIPPRNLQVALIAFPAHLHMAAATRERGRDGPPAR